MQLLQKKTRLRRTRSSFGFTSLGSAFDTHPDSLPHLGRSRRRAPRRTLRDAPRRDSGARVADAASYRDGGGGVLRRCAGARATAPRREPERARSLRSFGCNTFWKWRRFRTRRPARRDRGAGVLRRGRRVRVRLERAFFGDGRARRRAPPRARRLPRDLRARRASRGRARPQQQPRAAVPEPPPGVLQRPEGGVVHGDDVHDRAQRGHQHVQRRRGVHPGQRRGLALRHDPVQHVRRCRACVAARTRRREVQGVHGGASPRHASVLHVVRQDPRAPRVGSAGFAVVRLQQRRGVSV